MRAAEPFEAILARRVVALRCGCWAWQPRNGGTPEWRLPTFRRGGERYSHRVSWAFFFGPVPKGLELDHLCENPLCCNPLHLEPTTKAMNLSRRGTVWLGRKEASPERRQSLLRHGMTSPHECDWVL